MNKKYRKAIIAGNWKMNMLPSEVKPFTEELRPMLPRQKTCEVALCVPATHISPLRRSLKDSRIAVGAEDVSVHDAGAFTGEVSADMLTVSAALTTTRPILWSVKRRRPCSSTG